MSRPVIPIHVKNLINELSPFVAKGAKDMDVIFAGLLSLKEKYILPYKTSINHPSSPFYTKATASEEQGLIESFEALEKGEYKIITPEQDILEELKKDAD